MKLGKRISYKKAVKRLKAGKYIFADWGGTNAFMYRLNRDNLQVYFNRRGCWCWSGTALFQLGTNAKLYKIKKKDVV